MKKSVLGSSVVEVKKNDERLKKNVTNTFNYTNLFVTNKSKILTQQRQIFYLTQRDT